MTLALFFEPGAQLHERAFLARLRATCARLGHREAPTAADADLSILFGWDPLLPSQPTVYCECGWLPRWTFQLSWRGVNAESHLAGDSPPAAASSGDGRAAERALAALRSKAPPAGWPQFRYADPRGPVAARGLPREFLLVPFQVEGDRNLQQAQIRSMQHLVRALSRWDPPLPLVYRRHPARAARRQQSDGLKLRSGDVVLEQTRAQTIHQVLKHPGCHALVTLNSNAAHDALLWGVPVIALERGIWPDDGPFWCQGLPWSWRGFLQFAAGEGMRRARLDYAAWLMAQQWTLHAASSQRRVAGLLERTMAEEPRRR